MLDCPNYVRDLIDRRARLAAKLSTVDSELCQWLDKKGILETLETYDTCGGAEMYVNPYASAKRIRDAIEAAP